MDAIALHNFSELSDLELYCIDGGLTWAGVCDIAVAAGGLAVSIFCPPAAGIVYGAFALGYTIGRSI